MALVLTTYLQSFIQHSDSLSQIIVERALYTKKKLAGIPKKSNINQSDLDSVLLGPYKPFIQRAFHAHATIENLKQQLSEHSESIFKDSKKDEHSDITQSHLNKTSITEIDRIEKSLASKISQHNADFTMLFDQWCNEIEHHLREAGLQLFNSDTDELRLSVPIDELLESVNHAKIPNCSLRKAKHYDFKHYFTLKIKYLLHNYLNRMQESIEANTLDEKISAYNEILNKIHTEEVSFLDQIHNDYEEILKPISFAKKHKQQTDSA